MTYGIDECRRCGNKIRIPDAGAIIRYQESLQRKPTMTPEQWRAAGWKQAPTKHQLLHAMDGCCHQCKDVVRQKYSKYPLWKLAVGASLLVAIAMIIALSLASMTL